MSRSQIRSYLRPRGPYEAWEILGSGDPSVRALAGGTDLAIACPPEVETLVDVSGALPGGVERTGDGLAIGAMTTLTELLEDPRVAAFATGVVAEMLVEVGSPLLRNACTIGGHLARGKLSDVIPVLLALDAGVTVFRGEEERLSLAAYYDEGVHSTPHLLVRVHLPEPPPPAAAAFMRFARTGFDFPLANCAVLLFGAGGVRIVVGATPQRGRRALRAEAEVAAGGEAALDRAAAAAAAEIPVGSSWVVGADYRRQLVAVLVRRTLERAFRRRGAP